MTDPTPRHALPLLIPGQYQKELFHNEALLLADALLHPAVASLATATEPADPEPGGAWIVGAGAGGGWSGQAGRIAMWTPAGWRFVAPVEGMEAWVRDAACPARFVAGQWQLGIVRASELRVAGTKVVGSRGAPVASPAGGAVIDQEARSAISALLDRLRAHGLIAA